MIHVRSHQDACRGRRFFACLPDLRLPRLGQQTNADQARVRCAGVVIDRVSMVTGDGAPISLTPAGSGPCRPRSGRCTARPGSVRGTGATARCRDDSDQQNQGAHPPTRTDAHARNLLRATCRLHEYDAPYGADVRIPDRLPWVRLELEVRPTLRQFHARPSTCASTARATAGRQSGWRRKGSGSSRGWGPSVRTALTGQITGAATYPGSPYCGDTRRQGRS